MKIDIDALGGADDITTYPITLREMKFVPNKSATKGAQTLDLKRLYSHYNLSPSGVTNPDTDVKAPKVSVNGNVINVAGAERVTVYNTAGVLVSTSAVTTVTAGVYVVVADGIATKVAVR